MFIDSHTHPLLQKEKSLESILDNFQRSGGKYLISIGTNLISSKGCVNLANSQEIIYSTVGIHPCDVMELKDSLDSTIKTLEELYLNNTDNVVGIGETGLDYYRINKENIVEEKQIQKEFFVAHIRLAKKYNLPVIVHNREAGDDTIDILKEENCHNFIIHCFSEDYDFALKCLDISPNCYFAFGGVVTFKNAKAIADAAVRIPLKNLLVETDAPYLTPSPFRGKQENEPAYTKYVLEKIKDLRSEDRDKIEEIILENSQRVYNLK